MSDDQPEALAQEIVAQYSEVYVDIVSGYNQANLTRLFPQAGSELLDYSHCWYAFLVSGIHENHTKSHCVGRLARTVGCQQVRYSLVRLRQPGS